VSTAWALRGPPSGGWPPTGAALWPASPNQEPVRSWLTVAASDSRCSIAPAPLPARSRSGFLRRCSLQQGGGQAAPTTRACSGLRCASWPPHRQTAGAPAPNTPPACACSGFRFKPLAAPLQSSGRASCRCAPPLAPARASLRCAVKAMPTMCALVTSIFQILRHIRGAPRAILVFGGIYPLLTFGFVSRDDLSTDSFERHVKVLGCWLAWLSFDY
jgi:hypothetical protein